MYAEFQAGLKIGCLWYGCSHGDHVCVSRGRVSGPNYTQSTSVPGRVCLEKGACALVWSDLYIKEALRLKARHSVEQHLMKKRRVRSLIYFFIYQKLKHLTFGQ